MGSDIMQTGFLVGLKDEARIVRRFFPGCPVFISGGVRAEAERGASVLAQSGIKRLVSFGLAAGLRSDCPVGTIIVPDVIVTAEGHVNCSPELRNYLGGGRPGVASGGLLHSDVVVASASEKAALAEASGCIALDMESGFVALQAKKSGIACAALRVVCDPSDRSLPEAAQFALSPDGGINVPGMLMSLLKNPMQIGGMIGLGVESAKARRALISFLSQLPR
ncbi:MAG: hypothetical protein LKH81_11260 [Acetobacter sp.]|nr:hypothetical protein [Acetobacter sp.]MCH4062751.1 hypothetical protein [Acetobacter sp.]MCH4088403.1 hypothetical protein [Acetobacter sp.]MCI1294456.1 hypothetical protein [Acetobacter sp.]MCI1321073.1 hypothetical protein [Acetobacter sp.]